MIVLVTDESGTVIDSVDVGADAETPVEALELAIDYIKLSHEES